MVRRKKKIRYEDTEEYKKDLVHEIRFIKGDFAFPWRRLSGDPADNSKVIEDATQDFQDQERVSNWKEKADRYETRTFWFG